jgi:photosystem II stability/assembly factor-like uncharacterized protein
VGLGASAAQHNVEGYEGDLTVWRSVDGRAWEEVLRLGGTSLGIIDPPAGLTATADGFALAAVACPPKEGCHHFAMHSQDGRTWQASAVPVLAPPLIGGINQLAAAEGQAGHDVVGIGSTASQGVPGPTPPVLWRSADSGRSWQSVPLSDLPGSDELRTFYRVEAVGSRFVILGGKYGPAAGDQQALWRSDDRGADWSAVPLPADPGDIPQPLHLADAVSGSLVLTGGTSPAEPSLWQDDGQDHWSPAESIPDLSGRLMGSGGALAFVHAGSSSGVDGRIRIWGVEHGGRFTPVYDSGPLDRPTVQTSVREAGVAYVYASVGRGGLRHLVVLEADERCAAHRCSGSPVIQDPPDAFTQYRADPKPVIIGPRLLVGDGGAYADVTPAQVVGSAVQSVEDAVFVDRQHGWCAVIDVNAQSSWVLRTVDGGRNWETVHQGGFSDHAGTSLRLAAIDAAHVWMTYTVAVASGPGSVARSSDGGRTWSGGDFPVDGKLVFPDRRHGFAAADFQPGGDRLYGTTDGGATWGQRTVLLPPGATADNASYGLPRFFGSTGIMAVAVVEPSPHVREVTRSRMAFYKTEDEGLTWVAAGIFEPPSGSPPVYLAKPASPEVWWLLWGGSVATTTDAGGTWVTHPAEGLDGPLSALAPQDGDTAIGTEWLAGTSSLVVTRDGGKTWVHLTPSGSPRSGPGSRCPSRGPARLPTKAMDLNVRSLDLDGDGAVDRLITYSVPSGRTVLDAGSKKRVDPEPQHRVRAELSDGTVLDVDSAELVPGNDTKAAVRDCRVVMVATQR